MRKTIENTMYFILTLLIIAQCVVGENFYLGQGLFLLGNVLKVFRTFYLKRPVSDKITDISFTAVTIGIIMIRLLKGA